MKFETINGLKIFAATNSKQLIDFAINNKKILIAINAEKILNSNENSRKLINKNLGYPDGIGAVWALRKKGFENVVKIPGCELWLEIIASSYQSKSFYLIGGTQKIIDKVICKLKSEFLGINILNYRNGFIKSKSEHLELLNDVKQLKPDIIFVALGSPKQEFLMEEMYKSHKGTYQGLGGSFDVYTGHVERAPNWWVNKNLEWAYRLIKQPTRIKRQIHLLRFYFLLKLNKL